MGEYGTNNSLKEYSTYWEAKIEKKNQYLLERKKVLMIYAKKCSDLLKERFKVKEVYLIGSLLRDRRIHEKSDIDIVVIGLSDYKYFSALKELYQILPKGINIDLITEENASKSMREIIKMQGVLI